MLAKYIQIKVDICPCGKERDIVVVGFRNKARVTFGSETIIAWNCRSCGLQKEVLKEEFDKVVFLPQWFEKSDFSRKWRI